MAVIAELINTCNIQSYSVYPQKFSGLNIQHHHANESSQLPMFDFEDHHIAALLNSKLPLLGPSVASHKYKSKTKKL